MVIYAHDRSGGTGAEAGIEFEGYAVVLGFTLVLQTELVHHPLQNVGRAFQVAGWSPADFDIVLARRGESEICVEGRYAPDFVDRRVVEGGYFFHRFIGYVAQLVLNGEKG